MSNTQCKNILAFIFTIDSFITLECSTVLFRPELSGISSVRSYDLCLYRVLLSCYVHYNGKKLLNNVVYIPIVLKLAAKCRRDVIRVSSTYHGRNSETHKSTSPTSRIIASRKCISIVYSAY